MSEGRLLALDVGGERIGVAVSDEMGILASPAGMIRRRGPVLQELRTYIDRYRPVKLIVGLPVGLSGREGPQAKEVRDFVAGLEEQIAIPVEYWDERLTTSIAEKALIGHGVRRKDRRDQVDAMAASVILQGYLDHAKWQKGSGRR